MKRPRRLDPYYAFVKKKSVLWAVGSLALLFAAYLGGFNYTESYEAGLAWNRATGELWVQSSGMHLTSPWVAVSNIDTRPVRVCVTSSGRSFNCKLVQFVPSAYREFVATQGHHYYWWANRLSFNGGYDDEYRGMKDLLRGYAYGIKSYPFVAVLQDYPDTP